MHFHICWSRVPWQSSAWSSDRFRNWHGRRSDYVSAILALYAAGAFWFAWREKFAAFCAGRESVLLFFTSAQVCHSLLSVRFPWQASFLFFAAICTTGALVARQFGQPEVEQLIGGAAAKVRDCRLSCGRGFFAETDLAGL